MCSSVMSVESAMPLKKRHSLNEPFGPPSPLGAVVGDDHDDRVLELAGLLEVVDHAAQPVVCIGDVPGETSADPREEPLLVGGQKSHGRTVSKQRPRLTVRARGLRLCRAG